MGRRGAIKRGWPFLILLVVWGAVLAVPRTRDCARGFLDQWKSLGIFFTGGAFGTEPSNSWDGLKYTEYYQQLLTVYPDNRDLRRVIVMDRPNQNDRKPLSDLAARYPQDPFAVALQMRFGFYLIGLGRNQGPLNNPNYPAKAPPDIPPNAEDKKKLLKHLQLAKQGQKLDPNNTYFDWQAMYALFALRRDREAFAVLRRSAHKTGYNDFQLDERRAYYNARSLARAQAPMESMLFWVSILSSDASRSRQVARLVMEHAIADRQRHHTATAVSDATNLLRVARTMRQSSPFFIDTLVAQAIERLALTTVQVPKPGVRTRPAITLSRTDNLAGLAMRAGKPEIAREAMDEDQVLRRWKAARWPYESYSCGIVPKPIFSVTRMLEQASWLIFAATRVVLPLYGLLLLLSWKFGWGHGEDAVPTRRYAVWGGILGLLILFGLVAADITWDLRSRNLSWKDALTEYYGLSGLMWNASWWVAGLPIVVLVGLALTVAARRQGLQSPPVEVEHELSRMGVSGPLNFSVQRFFPPLARISLILASIGVMIWYAVFYSGESDARYGTALLLPLLLCLWGSPLVSLVRRPGSFEAVRLATTIFRHACAGYLVVLWICLGLAILAALPGLQTFDLLYQRALVEGEMPFFRAQVGL